VPGLEGVGLVQFVGPQVSRAAPGDLVIIGPTPAAGVARAAECPSILFADGATQTGRPLATWATNAIVDEQFVTAVAGDLPDRERLAVLGDTVLKPAAAIAGGGVQPGARVVVAGQGGAGLAAVAAAVAAGASEVIALGTDANGLAKARALGATAALDARGGLPATLQADLLIDCAETPLPGFPLDRLVREGGRAVLAVTGGTPEAEAALQGRAAKAGYDAPPPADPDAVVAAVADWIRRGVFDPAALIRKRYTIEQVNEAIIDMESGATWGQAILVLEPVR
jgi:D-arabinose 1-dehydrogenase-like Zn-dependent alcohol dehydrogenase